MGRKFQEAASKLLEVMRRSWLKKHGVPLPAPTMTAQQRAEIQECFEMLDRDGSGALDVREIIHAFGALGFTISKDAIEELMMEADPDGSGELEFDEFLSLMGRALYQPDERGVKLVAKTCAGDLSFADVVRAFRRKKLIESLIRGGDARLKVVEFHERVQELIRAETEELRQRQNTHAIFERMENVKAERDRLSKVVVAPASQRSQKMKAKLQEAIGRSLGVFESLYRRHQGGTGDGAGGSLCDGPSGSLTAPESESSLAARSTGDGTGEPGSGTILSSISTVGAPPRSTVTFLTQLHAESSAGVLQGLELRGKRPAAARSMDFTRPATRSLSTSLVDSAQSRRVSAAVLKYFKHLEDQAKKVEQRYDEAARLNASFIPAPPDRSDFTQAMLRPNARTAAAAPASASAGAGAAGSFSAGSSSRRGGHTSSSGLTAAGAAGAGRFASSSGSSVGAGSGRSSPEVGPGGGARGAAAAAPHPPAHRASAHRQSAHRASARPSGVEARRHFHSDSQPKEPPLRQPGPSTAAWAEFLAAAAALNSGDAPAFAAAAAAAADAAAAAVAAAAAAPAAPPAPHPPPPPAAVAAAAPVAPAGNTAVMAGRAWRQAPSFGPGGSVAASAFGWGSGMPPGAVLRASGGPSSPGLPTSRSALSGAGSIAPGAAAAAAPAPASPHPEAAVPSLGPGYGNVGDVWASQPDVQQAPSSPTTPVAAASSRVASARDQFGARPSSGCGAAAPAPPLPPVGAAAAAAAAPPPKPVPRSTSPTVATSAFSSAAAWVGSLSPSPSPEPPGGGGGGGGGGWSVPAPEPQPSRSNLVSGGVLGQPSPGPMTRAWLAHGRNPLGESLHGGGGSGRLHGGGSAASLGHARSLPPGGGGSGGGLAPQRSVRRIATESLRRHGSKSTSTNGIVPLPAGAGGGAVSVSGAAATGPLSDRGRSTTGFSHGPFRAASRGPATMGSAVGPAAAALVDGIVSVSPAPGLAPTSGFVVPGLPAVPPIGGGGAGGSGGARPRELSRYARLGGRSTSRDSDGGGASTGRSGGGGGGGGRERSGSGSGESDSYLQLGRVGSRGDWGSETGGSVDGAPASARRAPSMPPLMANVVAAATPANAPTTVASAAAATEAAAAMATAGSADGGVRDGAATSSSGLLVRIGSGAEGASPAEPQLPVLSPRLSARIGGTASAAANGTSPLTSSAPIGSGPQKPDAREARISGANLPLRPFNSLPLLKPGQSQGDIVLSPQAAAAAAGAAAAAPAAPATASPPSPPLEPTAPPAVPPASVSSRGPSFDGDSVPSGSLRSYSGASVSTANTPMPTNYTMHSTYSISGAAATAALAPSASTASPPPLPLPPPPPAASSAVPSMRGRGASGGGNATVAAAVVAATNPSTYAPRGAYMSLQLAAQRDAAAQSSRSSRRGGGASGAGGASGGALKPSPSTTSSTAAVVGTPPPTTPLADRVVVTFFGQTLPRARNGAVILPAVGPSPQSYPPELQPVASGTSVTAAAALASRSSLPPSHSQRPWAAGSTLPPAGTSGGAGGGGAATMGAGPSHHSPIATTAAAAAAWLTSAGGPPGPWSAAAPPMLVPAPGTGAAVWTPPQQLHQTQSQQHSMASARPSAAAWQGAAA